jgi:ABC-type transport system substrate-binding protein
MKRVGSLVAGMVLTIAACGGQASEQTTTTTATPATSTTTSTTVAAGAEVTPITVDPCTLVTTEEVTAATGLAVTEVKNESPTTCIFDFGQEAGVAIFLSVDDGEGGFTAPSSLFENYTALVADGGAETIADLGAAAVFAQSYRGLAVDAGGGRFFALGVNGGYGQLAEPRDAFIGLAGIAAGRL